MSASRGTRVHLQKDDGRPIGGNGRQLRKRSAVIQLVPIGNESPDIGKPCPDRIDFRRQLRLSEIERSAAVRKHVFDLLGLHAVVDRNRDRTRVKAGKI